MSKSIECESRAMLTEEEHRTVLSDLLSVHTNIKPIEQTNIYIDSYDMQLRRDFKCTLRIRRIKNTERNELTLKIKGNNGDTELTDYIHNEILMAFVHDHVFPEGEVKESLQKMGANLAKLHILAELKTIRYEFVIQNYLVVIDENHYSGIIDYNIEIEAPTLEIAQNAMTEYCNKYNIKYTTKYKTKHVRALEAALLMKA